LTHAVRTARLIAALVRVARRVMCRALTVAALSFPVYNVPADVPPKSVGARPYFVILALLTRDVQLNADPAGTRFLLHRD
jgi:hypothetical protein